MLRTLQATIAAAAFAGTGFLAGTAHAQWGHYPGPTYLHAPYAGTNFSFGYGTGSRYSLYGPSYGQAFGYQTAYPACGYTAPALPVYDYSAYPGPGIRGPRGRLKYDVYTPYGRQEVEYRFRRDGSVRVDVDD